MHNQKLKNNQATEAELIKGRNGISIFNDFSRLPEDAEDCSREEIMKLYKLRRDY
jgi:hypothetical protein